MTIRPKNIKFIRDFYSSLDHRIREARRVSGRPLTLSEKILLSHLHPAPLKIFQIQHVPARGSDYCEFFPDRVDMQDVTAQMALLQLMTTSLTKTVVPAAIHCDHLIRVEADAKKDVERARRDNAEIYDFLLKAARKYGIEFWGAGSGIIHQVVLENYAFPGGLMVGTDSHTPNAGGIGMLAIGVGGADAVDVLTGTPWELKVPNVIGVRLTGKLSGWASPKDVILKLAGLLSVKGGTGHILEYFGTGVETISCTGRATICNMGAEVGATTSIFPYDRRTAEYLRKTGRAQIADEADKRVEHFVPDSGATYDREIEIDLSALQPYINGPFTPDRAHALADFASTVVAQGWPRKISMALIGSCTNSSYEDIDRIATIADIALKLGLKPKCGLVITPGSERVRATLERDGQLSILRRFGATIMANACGPCVAQWKRTDNAANEPNSIVTSFNRNFVGRNDGNPQTHAFLASPETVMGFALVGDLTIDFTRALNFEAPGRKDLPSMGLEPADGDLASGVQDAATIEDILIDPRSERLQRLTPFAAPRRGVDFSGLRLLIKVRGKCTTDHISMAGPWLRYRGHLENISDNLLITASNAFNGKANCVKNALHGTMGEVPATARDYKANGIGWIIVAEDNYGEGSSREHAALEPRYLGAKAVIAKSFARIHESNLKKQGLLPLTFSEPLDYEKIREDDVCSIAIAELSPGRRVHMTLKHTDGSHDVILLNHTFNAKQIEWFEAGSALNLRRS